MKISKYQFDKNVLQHISFDDYHEAVEDAIALYNLNGKQYIVICINELKEDDGTDSYVVLEHQGFFKLEIVFDEEIIKNVLELYELDE